MIRTRGILGANDFRYALIPPPAEHEYDGEFVFMFLPDSLASETTGAYLVISALRKISTWNGSEVSAQGEARAWGFTMEQAHDALEAIGMSEEEATWFLTMLQIKVPMVPLYNEKPPAF